MGKTTGFLEIGRGPTPKRPVDERLRDFREVEGALSPDALRAQAARCMDCGIPFCHQGCPLGNEIPDWNDLAYRDRFERAATRLHGTNNFPEITGRICPAPCERACVLDLHGDAVAIRQIEKQIADRALADGARPQPAERATGRSVAIVGSGPAGLAAAQQLARAGHAVTVLERDDRPGGLLRYGIPDFKLDRVHVDRRVAQMGAEGVTFRTGVEVGVDVTLAELRSTHDAVLLAVGAQRARDLPVPGRDLDGVHPAMDYLVQQNRRVAGDAIDEPVISAEGRRVVVLGGGDTGADCLGTALRQGALSVHHFHYKPAPPSERTAEMPWPWWPMVLHESSSHEEGGERGWSTITRAFRGDERGHVTHMDTVEVEWVDEGDRRVMRERPGTRTTLPVDLVLLAIGFEGAELDPFPEIERTRRGTVAIDPEHRTSVPSVWACGDATRGASLAVWAIWEGREVARRIDLSLMGRTSLRTVPNHDPL